MRMTCSCGGQQHVRFRFQLLVAEQKDFPDFRASTLDLGSLELCKPKVCRVNNFSHTWSCRSIHLHFLILIEVAIAIRGAFARSYNGTAMRALRLLCP